MKPQNVIRLRKVSLVADPGNITRWTEKRSYILRRSGIAVGLIMDLLEWTPDIMYQVGVGLNCQEVVDKGGKQGVLPFAWPSLRFVGMEPHPRIVEGLGDNYPGDLHQTAIADFVGTSMLHSKKRHKDGSSLHTHDDKHEDEKYYDVEVPVTTLDTLFPGGPDGEHVLLWVDCEGSELAALRGGEAFLNGVEMVNVELTGKPPGAGWCDCWEVDEWLQEHGFMFQWVHTQRSSAGQRDGIYVRPHMFRPEFACCGCQVKRFKQLPSRYRYGVG